MSALAGDWESKQESSSPAGGGTRGSDQDKNSDHDSVSIHSTGSSQGMLSHGGIASKMAGDLLAWEHGGSLRPVRYKGTSGKVGYNVERGGLGCGGEVG